MVDVIFNQMFQRTIQTQTRVKNDDTFGFDISLLLKNIVS